MDSNNKDVFDVSLNKHESSARNQMKCIETRENTQKLRGLIRGSDWKLTVNDPDELSSGRRDSNTNKGEFPYNANRLEPWLSTK